MKHLVVIRKRAAGFVLRCFDCDWGVTVKDRRESWRWQDAHELEGRSMSGER